MSGSLWLNMLAMEIFENIWMVSNVTIVYQNLINGINP